MERPHGPRHLIATGQRALAHGMKHHRSIEPRAPIHPIATTPGELLHRVTNQRRGQWQPGVVAPEAPAPEVGVLEVAPAGDEPERIAPCSGVGNEREAAQLARQGRGLPHLEERLFAVDAPQRELGLVRGGRRRVQDSVGGQAQGLHAGHPEIVLHPGDRVHPEPHALEVVELDARRQRRVARRPGEREQRLDGRHVVEPRHRPAAPVRPHEVKRRRAENLREAGELGERLEVGLARHRGKRRLEAQRRQEPEALRRLVEAPSPSQGIVHGGGRSVERDLKANPGAIERGQRVPMALEQRRVGQDHQLAPVVDRDVLDEREEILPEERLATREEHPLDAQRDRLVDDVTEHLGREPSTTLGARRHEAVPALQVARVIGVKPELAQRPLREVLSTASVGHPLEGLGRNQPRARGSLNEVHHVLVGLDRVTGHLGQAGHLGAPEDLRASCVGREPVRPLGVEREVELVSALPVRQGRRVEHRVRGEAHSGLRASSPRAGSRRRARRASRKYWRNRPNFPRATQRSSAVPKASCNTCRVGMFAWKLTVQWAQ